MSDSVGRVGNMAPIDINNQEISSITLNGNTDIDTVEVNGQEVFSATPLIAYWPMDNANGNVSVIADTQGQFDLSVPDTQVFSYDSNQNAYHIDGTTSSSAVSSQTYNRTNNELSMSYYIKINTYSVDEYFNFVAHSPDQDFEELMGTFDDSIGTWMWRSGNRDAYGARVDGLNTVSTSRNPSADEGVWVHHVWTWDGSQFDFYFDGSSDGNYPVSASSLAANYPFIVSGGNRSQDFFIRDVKAFSKSLTATEVSDLNSTGSISG